MVLSFVDMLDKYESFGALKQGKLFTGSKVVFLCGKINIATFFADMLKSVAVRDIVEDGDVNLDDYGFGGFTLSKSRENSNLSLSEFKKVNNLVSDLGAWYCLENLGVVSKRDIEWIESYVEQEVSSELNSKGRYSLLVLICSDYRVYKSLISGKIGKLAGRSRVVNLIKLDSYNARTAKKFLKLLLRSETGVSFTEQALGYMYKIVGRDLGSYFEVVERVKGVQESILKGEPAAVSNLGNLSYKDARSLLSGLENYELDDILRGLLHDLAKDDKVTQNKLAYKRLYALADDLGIDELVKRLNYRLSAYISLRVLINKGYIPIRIKYSVQEAQSRLEDGEYLKGVSSANFRYMVNVASEGSLKEWITLREMLRYSKGSRSFSKLYRVLNRRLIAHD